MYACIHKCAVFVCGKLREGMENGRTLEELEGGK